MKEEKVEKREWIIQIAEQLFAELGYDGASTRLISQKAGVNMAMLDALVLSKRLLGEKSSSVAIAAYEAEMFARMRHMTVNTMENTEMFYAPDASDRVVALFRSFGGATAAPPVPEA